MQTWIDLGKKWVLEALRIGTMAAVSAVINYGLDLLSGGQVPLNPYLIGILTTALKSADRSIHESKKIKSDGILPF